MSKQAALYQNKSKSDAATASSVLALREKILDAALAKAAGRTAGAVGSAGNFGTVTAGSGPGIDISGAWWIGSVNTTVLKIGSQLQITITNPTSSTATVPGAIQIGNPTPTIAAGSPGADTTIVNITGTVSINGSATGFGDYASTSTTATQFTAIPFATVTNQAGSITSTGSPVTTIVLPVGYYDVSWRAQVGAGSPSALSLGIFALTGVIDGVTGGALGAGTVLPRTVSGVTPVAASVLACGSRNIIRVTTAGSIQLAPTTATAGQTLAVVGTNTAELVIRAMSAP
jgi:hypothetical protein